MKKNPVTLAMAAIGEAVQSLDGRVEKIEAQDLPKRVGKLEKLAMQQAREIADLQLQLRDSDIRNRVSRGEKQTDVARKVGLTPARVNQIVHH